MKICRRHLSAAVSVSAALLYASAFRQAGSAQGSGSRMREPYTWKPVKIVAGGFVSGIVMHPTEAGLWYLRTDIGGAYRWNPDTNQWIPLLDWESPANYNLTGVESIALDPNDPTRLYLAVGMYTSGSAAILSSTDRGAHFATHPLPVKLSSNGNGRNMGERMAVNPFSPNQIFLGTRTNGLYRSDDYGVTWNQVASFPISPRDPGLVFVLFDPQHSGTVFVGANQGNGLYRTVDGGATWQAIPGQPSHFASGSQSLVPTPARAALTSTGSLYITYGDQPGPNGMTNGAVWKLNTASDTWTDVTPPMETNPRQTTMSGFCGVSVDAANPDTVVVSTLDRWYPIDTVYRTTDGGSTWVSLAALANFTVQDISLSPYLAWGATPKFGWWMGSVAIDPTDSNRAIFGTGATVYGTNDLKRADAKVSPHWFVEADGIEETAVLALISPAAGAHLLSGVADIGGFRHDDLNVSPPSGMSSNPIFGNTTGLDYAGQNPSVVARVGNSSPYGAYSKDGGATWTPFTAVGSGNGSIAVSADGSAFVWTPDSGNSMYYSVDNGGHWTAVAGLPARATIVSDRINPLKFYAYQNTGTFYISIDGGKSFTGTPVPLPRSTSIPRPVFGREGDLWMAFGGSGLYHSVDSGATWTEVGSSTLARANMVAFGMAAPGAPYPALYLYGTVNGISGIYRSTDAGTTWIRINDDLHQFGGPTVIAADPRIFGRVYLGMNGRGIVYGDVAPRPPNAARKR
ncbi:MAG: carbohydrate-binding protein [Acidobacteriia bacterium]|nr:carbohydrate-binding protein [Terriglobia bacterium]